MAKRFQPKPIGLILQEAALVTPAQLEVALHEQQYFELPLGEILAHHGWINKETADFFVEQWPRIVDYSYQHPLGHYLRLASLLDEQQIRQILQEQKKLGIRFGATAVLKGWLKQQTIDYFLENLVPMACKESAFDIRRDMPTHTQTLRQTRTTQAQSPQAPHHRSKQTQPSPTSPYYRSAKTTSSRITHSGSTTHSGGPRIYNDAKPHLTTGTNPFITNHPDSEDFDLSLALQMEEGNSGLHLRTYHSGDDDDIIWAD
ncbi:hypothetical protein [Synechocystis sp. LKSZ1]|uniref:hypothetical protein n=1 Tax=Synechocystis sp. LKSZ1 TaxID=3144951 RepID=UPI00336BBD0B